MDIPSQPHPPSLPLSLSPSLSLSLTHTHTHSHTHAHIDTLLLRLLVHFLNIQILDQPMREQKQLSDHMTTVEVISLYCMLVNHMCTHKEFEY